jgi:hypothetical protein
MPPFVQVHANAVIGRVLHLMKLSTARRQWHNLAHNDLIFSARASGSQQIHFGSGNFVSHLPAAEKISYLLNVFSRRQCTNPLNRFCGLLRLLNLHELPQSLLQDHSLPYYQISHNYTRYMIEATGNLRMIESPSGHRPDICPSWVPNMKHLTQRGYCQEITVSSDNKPFYFSAGGCHLTLDDIDYGEIITCGCSACPTEYTDKHLDYIQETVLEGAAQITGKSMAETFKSWYKVQMETTSTQLVSLA